MYDLRCIPIVNNDIISLIILLKYCVTGGSLFPFFNFCHQYLQNLQIFEIFFKELLLQKFQISETNENIRNCQ